jgi:nucleotide-binding universal stress UspA family protein
MNNSLRTLLVATDLSAPSRHTAQRAAMLAQQIGARLELVHVLEQSALDELRELFKKMVKLCKRISGYKQKKNLLV